MFYKKIEDVKTKLETRKSWLPRKLSGLSDIMKQDKKATYRAKKAPFITSFSQVLLLEPKDL